MNNKNNNKSVARGAELSALLDVAFQQNVPL